MSRGITTAATLKRVFVVFIFVVVVVVVVLPYGWFKALHLLLSWDIFSSYHFL